MRRFAVLLITLLLIAVSASYAKKQELVLMWPQQDPTLKLTFAPFQSVGSLAGSSVLVSDVTVQNLSNKVMPRASFKISLLDRNNIRIGDGLLVIDDLNAGQSAKVQFQCKSVGQPVMLNIAAHNSGGVPTSTVVPVTIISIPPGATLKVDNQPAGTTPVTVRVLTGTHNLELHKEGYAVARTPLDVNPDETAGGSITITLGGLANDTIELRDGSILTGDVISVNMQSVVVSVQGNQQTLERNRIRKIFLVERVVNETPGPVAPPATPESQTAHP